jgi:vancomycin resistance protein YoaR
MQRVRTAGLVALGALLVVIVGAGAAWAIDGRGRDGKVARNVTLAGRSIGGMTAAEVRAVVASVAQAEPQRSVRVEVDGGRGFTTTAGDLGVAVDQDATVAAALDAGSKGTLPGRVVSWLWGFVRDRQAPVEVKITPSATYSAVRRLDVGRTDATEPSLAVEDGKLVAVPGKPGRGVDPAHVVEALPDALDHGSPSSTTTVHVARGVVPPRFPVARASALATEAEHLVTDGLKVRAGGTRATIPAKTLRKWMEVHDAGDDLALGVSPDEAAKGLAALLPDAGVEPVDAGFSVSGGTVVITPAKTGTACCGADAPTRVMEGLRAPSSSSRAVDLPLKLVEPKRTEAEARKLGIKEQVSTFTTPHKCCEPRVTNIHRIADLLRGVVIEPGETFSVNRTIGKRTREKGFVSAPVIENGQHSEDVGGGISQMATTLFNAAWFAGLDFGEYQSHSLYISRYPYGREATMGYPHPDLEVKNTTPYGILLWPTYTERSLTVSMYSTKYYESVTMSAQTKRPQGTCTVVRSERTRVLLDGERKVDSTSARYRAREGLNCDGSQAPPPKEG